MQTCVARSKLVLILVASVTGCPSTEDSAGPTTSSGAVGAAGTSTSGQSGVGSGGTTGGLGSAVGGSSNTGGSVWIHSSAK